jgi:hypothetical protein
MPSRQKQRYDKQKWDDFQYIGRQVCHNRSIEYIDLRAKFLKSVPWWWSWYGGSFSLYIDYVVYVTV